MFGRRPAHADARIVVTPIWPGDRACPVRPAATLPEPMREAVIVTADERCIVSHPLGGVAIVPIGAGLALGWTPAPELGGLVLAPFTASGADAGFATVITRPTLRALIADLQAIDAQLENVDG
jgi:hypothetical protein